jgi:hypothetical protein
MPFLEQGTAIPLEFIRFAVHLPGKHSLLRTWRSKKVQFSLLKFTNERSEAKMSVYHAYIVGSHSRFIGAVQMDCVDDDAAIKSASRLVDRHDVELWQMDRPVVRFDAASKKMFKKPTEAGHHGKASGSAS